MVHEIGIRCDSIDKWRGEGRGGGESVLQRHKDDQRKRSVRVEGQDRSGTNFGVQNVRYLCVGDEELWMITRSILRGQNGRQSINSTSSFL